jgi:hypothetical protein
MTSQLISLLIIIAVLVIDFIINGRKKNVDDTQKRIEGYEGLKKFNLYEYLLIRKKNVVIFILFVFLSKPILHSSFFPNTKESVNYDKKIKVNRSSEDFYLMDNEQKLISIRDTVWLESSPDLPNLAYRDKAYTIKGEKYIYDIRGETSSIFYYPLETLPLSFNEHLELMFKSKLWIFLVSLGTMGIIIFLFNDKIKAR